MSRIYENAFFGDSIRPFSEATVSVASSAVLYGLSVYTVFPVNVTETGELVVFQLHEHYRRLVNSARIIGIDTFEPAWQEERFARAIMELINANSISEPVFVRATVHVTDLVPGTHSRGLATNLSMFIYEAKPILPQSGARLKTSVWRRVPDYAIPSRAKVNGAYVNSVLAKQDAIDSGYDDSIFLDSDGHVCELSAANIFIVRDGVVITPDVSSDILEGINRKTILEICSAAHIRTAIRRVDLTELYMADEVFAAGTSAFVVPILEVDKRVIGNGAVQPVTALLRERWAAVQNGRDPAFAHLATVVGRVHDIGSQRVFA